MTVDAQTIYCEDCGEDYRLAWTGDAMLVACDCDVAETVRDFCARFAEVSDGDSLSTEGDAESDDDPDNRMFR